MSAWGIVAVAAGGYALLTAMYLIFRDRGDQ